MKLSKYAKLVKQSGSLYLCHVGGSGVWLGTRYGFYRASGLPETVDSDTIMTILDFDGKAADKIMVQERYFETVHDLFGMDLSDDPASDIEAKKIEITAIYKGTFATALLCNDGELVFYDEAQLAPLTDILKESDYVQTVVRVNPDGTRYVVIRDGFDTEAGIMPLKIIRDEYLGAMQESLTRCVMQKEREDNRAIGTQILKNDEALREKGLNDED